MAAILQVLLALATLATTWGASGPDYWQDSLARFTPCLSKGYRMPLQSSYPFFAWELDDVRPCLMNYTLSLHDAALILNNVQYGTRQIYSFSTIARDSKASTQRNKCDLQPHDVNVKLVEELTALENEVLEPEVQRRRLRELGEDTPPEEIRRRLMDPMTTPALSFHLRIHDMFARLGDAHTHYTIYSIIYQVLPVTFKLESQGPAAVKVLVQPGNQSAKLLNMSLPFSGVKEVLTINGREPLEFLQSIADQGGSNHGRGQRLNRMLLSVPMGDLALFPDSLGGTVGAEHNLQPESRVKMVFTDGSEAEVPWYIWLTPPLTEEQLRGENPAYTTVKQLQQFRRDHRASVQASCSQELGGECPLRRLDAIAPETPSLALPALRRLLSHLPDSLLERVARLEPVSSSSPDGVGLAPEEAGRPTTLVTQNQGRRLSASATFNQTKMCLGIGAAATPSWNLSEVVHVRPHPSGAEWCTVMSDGVSMVVLKLTGMGDEPVMDYLDGFMEAYMDGVKYARARNITRLLVDLVSNDGGLVVLSDIIQSLLLKNYDTAKLCPLYNVRINPYWSKYIESFGHGIRHKYSQYAAMSGGDPSMNLTALKWYGAWKLKYIRGILEYGQQLNVKSNLTLLNDSILKMEAATSKDEYAAVVRKVFMDLSWIPEGTTLERATGTEGWFPFSNGDLDPKTLKPYPNMSNCHDENLLKEQWGGGPTTFSRKYVFDVCRQGIDYVLDPKFKAYLDHPFSDIAVLTDGLSGSAGSQLATKLQASGYVSVFSYGGRPDEILDQSSFAGGNVLGYATWWRQVLMSAEVGRWLLPSSPWEQYVHMNNFTREDNTVIYPLPMPIKALFTRFNFNMMYVPEWGVDDTDLPREYYVVPAHKHYQLWIGGLSEICSNSPALIDMYARVQQEDWWEVRAHPERLGQGWSAACVPGPEKRECCAVTNAPSTAGPPASTTTIPIPPSGKKFEGTMTMTVENPGGIVGNPEATEAIRLALLDSLSDIGEPLRADVSSVIQKDTTTARRLASISGLIEAVYQVQTQEDSLIDGARIAKAAGQLKAAINAQMRSARIPVEVKSDVNMPEPTLSGSTTTTTTTTAGPSGVPLWLLILVPLLLLCLVGACIAVCLMQQQQAPKKKRGLAKKQRPQGGAAPMAQAPSSQLAMQAGPVPPTVPLLLPTTTPMVGAQPAPALMVAQPTQQFAAYALPAQYQGGAQFAQMQPTSSIPAYQMVSQTPPRV